METRRRVQNRVVIDSVGERIYGDAHDSAKKSQRKHCLAQILGLVVAGLCCVVLFLLVTRQSRVAFVHPRASQTSRSSSNSAADVTKIENGGDRASHADPTGCTRLTTQYGDMVWRFFPDHAPKTVENFRKLIAMNFYDGMSFYRAEKGFCLQGGGRVWKDNSQQPSPFPSVPLEYSLPNDVAYISTARTSDPNSATTEFSIMLGDNSKWLAPHGSDPHGYAVFARVVSGWETVRIIASQPVLPDSSGIRYLIDKVEIVSMALEPCPEKDEEPHF